MNLCHSSWKIRMAIKCFLDIWRRNDKNHLLVPTWKLLLQKSNARKTWQSLWPFTTCRYWGGFQSPPFTHDICPKGILVPAMQTILERYYQRVSCCYHRFRPMTIKTSSLEKRGLSKLLLNVFKQTGVVTIANTLPLICGQLCFDPNLVIGNFQHWNTSCMKSSWQAAELFS